MNHDVDIDWLVEHRPLPAPPSQATTDRARASLIAHATRRRRARHGTAALATAVVVAVAGGLALASQRPSHGTSHSTRVSSSHGPSRYAAARGRSHLPVAGAPRIATFRSPLIRLASDVRLMPSAPQPGDATLVVRDTVLNGSHESDGAVYGGYDLYTDSGQYYYAPDSLAQLQQMVDSHQTVPYSGNEAGALDTIAGAAGETPAQAREATLSTFPHGLDPMPTPAQVRAADRQLARFGKRIPYVAPTPASWREHQDSIVWIAATEALAVGAGRSEVRAGAMKALSTIEHVIQTPTELDGVSALKVDFPAIPEIIWLNANTGVPIQEQDEINSATTYEVERVTASRLPSQISADARLR